MEGSTGRKRQTTERDHFLRTVRSSKFFGEYDNNSNTGGGGGTAGGNNNAQSNNSPDRKSARAHYFR